MPTEPPPAADAAEAPPPSPRPAETPQASFGIRAGYPRLPIGAKARAYLATIRPLTVLPVIVGVLAAAAMTVTYGYSDWARILNDWPQLVYGMGTLLIVQAGSNFLNASTDGEDRVNKPYRPVALGVVGRDEAATIGHLLWFFAIARAAITSPAFGFLTTLIVATSYAYSAPPMRLKRRPWMGNVGIAIARGLLGVVAAWTLWAPWAAPEPWAVGAILGLFLLGAATAKDFNDATGDAAHGVRTLVVAHGPRKAALLSLPFTITPILTIPIAHHYGLVQVPLGAYVASSLLIVVFAHRLLFRHGSGNWFFENGKAWVWMYVAMVGLLAAFAADGFVELGRYLR